MSIRLIYVRPLDIALSHLAWCIEQTPIDHGSITARSGGYYSHASHAAWHLSLLDIHDLCMVLMYSIAVVLWLPFLHSVVLHPVHLVQPGLLVASCVLHASWFLVEKFASSFHWIGNPFVQLYGIENRWLQSDHLYCFWRTSSEQ